MIIKNLLLQFFDNIYRIINSILGFPWISIVPNKYIPYLAPISLIIAGSLVDRHYTGRVQIFTNSIALNVLFYSSVYNYAYYGSLFLSFFTWYANIGLIMGMIALYSYAIKGSNSKIYYTIAWAYSSLVVGILIIIFYFYPYLIT